MLKTARKKQFLQIRFARSRQTFFIPPLPIFQGWEEEEEEEEEEEDSRKEYLDSDTQISKMASSSFSSSSSFFCFLLHICIFFL